MTRCCNYPWCDGEMDVFSGDRVHKLSMTMSNGNLRWVEKCQKCGQVSIRFQKPVPYHSPPPRISFDELIDGIRR